MGRSGGGRRGWSQFHVWTVIDGNENSTNSTNRKGRRTTSGSEKRMSSSCPALVFGKISITAPPPGSHNLRCPAHLPSFGETIGCSAAKRSNGCVFPGQAESRSLPWRAFFPHPLYCFGVPLGSGGNGRWRVEGVLMDCMGRT